MSTRSLLTALARSLLAGEQEREPALARLSRTLGRSWPWLEPLAQRYLERFGSSGMRARLRDVVQFLRKDRGFERARKKHARELSVEQWLIEPHRMQPASAAAGWDVPAITSVGDLADRFQLTPGELDWFADLKALGYKRRAPLLRHYHYRVLVKRSGGLRLVEAPKPRLKEMQRWILAGILEKIPAHSAAHGFVRGRSIRTFVAAHVAQRVVLRMDLRDYFPSFGGARIQAFFRTLGYPEPVADLLGGICTNAVPRDVWRRAAPDVSAAELREARELYARPHLPQGAPTSPALANLCTYRIDCRLAGLASSAGAHYTRYADDLAFSGGEAFARHVERFATHVAAILIEEGFRPFHRKTRVMRQGVRQHLAGIVTNRHANVMRRDFDRLKAVLTNCVRHGPAGQNRDAHPCFREHLEGRVAFVESVNPARGRRLRDLFNQIRWG